MKKYQRIAAQIKQHIALGAWRPGERLPSLREQMQQTGTSLITVSHAYQLLEREGVICVRPQSGYYLAEAPPREPQPPPGDPSDESVDFNGAIFDVLQASCRPDVVAFGSAFPDPGLFPQHPLNRALTRVSSSATAISVIDNLPPGNRALRAAIARRYAQQGMAINADEIVITAGALEALNLSLSVVTAPGDYVIVESPCFYGALQALQRLRLKPVAIPSSVTEGLDLDALEQALKRWPVKACWLMTTLQNPIGYTLSEEKKRRLVALLAHYNVVLIEDDVYQELYEGNTRPLPARAFDTAGNVLHCASFSKCLVAGFRIGWVAAGPYARKIQQMQFMSTLSTSSPMQLAVVEYLASQRYDSHLKRLRQTLAVRKQQAYEILVRHLPDDVVVHIHPGGYFLWLALPPDIAASTLYEQALRANISIAPGTMFTPHRDGEHFVRINTSRQWGSLDIDAVVTLSQLIQAARRAP